jgi:hypothetical protein
LFGRDPASPVTQLTQRGTHCVFALADGRLTDRRGVRPVAGPIGRNDLIAGRSVQPPGRAQLGGQPSTIRAVGSGRFDRRESLPEGRLGVAAAAELQVQLRLVGRGDGERTR